MSLLRKKYRTIKRNGLKWLFWGILTVWFVLFYGRFMIDKTFQLSGEMRFFLLVAFLSLGISAILDRFDKLEKKK